jgi:hypothetical protein
MQRTRRVNWVHIVLFRSNNWAFSICFMFYLIFKSQVFLVIQQMGVALHYGLVNRLVKRVLYYNREDFNGIQI